MTSVGVVTGAGGAMGAACTLALAPTVDALVLADIDRDRLELVTASVADQAACKVYTAPGDIGDRTGVDELVRTTTAIGDLRALVHTAGLSPAMADWREILRVDLTAVALLLAAYERHVVPGSAAVCLASIAAHLGTFDSAMDAVLDDPLAPDLAERYRALAGDAPDSGSTYRFAKRGVIRACERAAITWGARGGRVVSVSPGLIDTGMGRLELVHNDIKHTMAAMTPVGGERTPADVVLPGLVDDIADTVAFLCSPRAAFVSGCDLRVDGGLVAAMTRPQPNS